MALVLAGLALCLLAALPVQAARNTKKYCFPLDTAVWRISDVYGKRIDPFTGKAAFHQGLDLACAAGTAVRAVQDGVVTAAAYSPSYGNHLRILHPDGCETRYAHLQYLYVRPGEVVQAGQTLGTVMLAGIFSLWSSHDGQAEMVALVCSAAFAALAAVSSALRLRTSH